MSRKRRRPTRPYRVWVRTVRRDPIDFDALARAALEHAAMNQPQNQEQITESPSVEHNPRRDHRGANRPKEPRHDRLA